MQLDKQQIKDFLDACYQYDEKRIVDYLQQGYDPFEWQEEYDDFLYNAIVFDVACQEEGEEYKLALLPKLTQLFCDNGLDFAKINKYVGDGDHPSPFWEMGHLGFTQEFRQTVEIMVRHGMTADEFFEIIDHVLEDIIYLYDDREYGTPNSDTFHSYMKELMWFASFPDMLAQNENFKEFIRYNPDFDYTQFRQLDNFRYQVEEFDVNKVLAPANAKVEIFDLQGNKVYELRL